ncbi:MAG: hypothetical protein HC897_11110, partial [Thermoanaerobaculia bacterium]|nr:hypothetical protein [Thermoanaerobaculia bacterium]
MRLFAALQNLSAAALDSVVVDLTSLYGADSESLTLVETGRDTGVFEGTIPLSSFFVVANPGNLTLETRDSGAPSYVSDEITARYYGLSEAFTTATVISARLLFIDSFGQPVETVAVGEPVRLRAIDYNRGEAFQIDSFNISVEGLTGGDFEEVTLWELADGGGVFEGAIPSVLGGSPPLDISLGLSPGEMIRATLDNYPTPTLTQASALVVSSAVHWLDAQGQPTTTFLEGGLTWVQVIDHGANIGPGVDSAEVSVSSQLGGDFETLTLTETGGSTGVFTGSIRLQLGPGDSYDGYLQVNESVGPPHAFDTLTASHYDGFGNVTATATTLGSRTWFLDGFGNQVASYAVGESVHVRVEDHNRNVPGVFDTVAVTVESQTTGDSELVTLWETGKDTGVFEGSVLMSNSGAPSSNDGLLVAQAGESLRAWHEDALAFTISEDVAQVADAAIRFIDAEGAPTDELLEGAFAWIQVVSQASNYDPGVAETFATDIASLYGNDGTNVFLTETGPSTGVFEGQIRVSHNPGPGDLGISTSGSPAYLPDQVTAYYAGLEVTATMVASRMDFIDAFGQVVDVVPVSSPVRVRVVDHNQNDPGLIDSFDVQLTSLQTGDLEYLTVTETGFDTGIYEGSLATNTFAPTSYDGALAVGYGDTVTALHANLTSPAFAQATAVTVGSVVRWVDAAGQPATVFLEGDLAYVQVIDHGANVSPGIDSAEVSVYTELGGDFETLTLTETGDSTGVFTGSIRLQLGPGNSYDGYLQVNESAGPPHEFDTLTAAHNDGYAWVYATATTLGSRTWFIDGYGNQVSSYAVGETVHVRVEDHNHNVPGVFDTVAVTVESQTTGDSELLTLWETGKDTGVFEGSVVMSDSGAPGSNDGQLVAQVGESLRAWHEDALAFTISEDSALVTDAAVTFIDEEGAPTSELLEGDVARVRVVSRLANFNPGLVDTLLVDVSAQSTGDAAVVTLTETGISTSVFEGAVALTSGPDPGPGTLQTGNGGPPAYLFDQVTATFGGASATATTIGSRAFFIDAFGQVVTAVAVNAPVRVRVVDHNVDDPGLIDSFSVQLESQQTGDVELVTVVETGFDTGIYEGSLASSTSVPSGSDGTLAVTFGDTLVLTHANLTNPANTQATAVTVGSVVQWVDAAGQPSAVYLEGDLAYVQVIDHGANASPSVNTIEVSVSSDLGGDYEPLTLTETGGSTGVFTGSVRLQLGPGNGNDGYLQVNESAGPPHEFDTLVASHNDGYAWVYATATTLGSRTWFLDGFGNQVSSYAVGETVHVRVEDHNRNVPGVFDTVAVTVESQTTGDSELVTLWETGKNTGIFEGSVPLSDSGAPSSNDGLLVAQVGESLRAWHEDALAFTISEANALVTGAEIVFVDASGAPTTELLESDVARVRVVSQSSNVDPGLVDTVAVDVSAQYSPDAEVVTLTETGPSTGVFEGAVALTSGPDPGPGVLQTGNGGPPAYLFDQVTATFGGASATATTI